MRFSPEPQLARPRWAAATLPATVTTALLLMGLGGISAFVGYLVFGGAGVLLALGAVAVLATVGLQAPPEWVMRLNGAVPLSQGAAPGIHRMVATLAGRAGVPTPRLFVMPTAVPNAMTSGSGSQRGALAVTTGTLELLDRHELEGVLAHEIAHLRNRDTSIQLTAGLVSQAVGLLLEVALWSAMLGALLGVLSPDRLIVLLLLALAIPTVLRLMRAALSRTREFAADATAAALTGKPWALASALTKLSAVKHSWLAGWLGAPAEPSLLRSHPATVERVRRLRTLGRGPFSRAPDATRANARANGWGQRPPWWGAATDRRA